MDRVLGNNMMTKRHDDYRENNSSVMNTETQKDEIPWLKSLMVFCSRVSVVGLSYVFNPSASVIRRSIWLLLILAGAAFTTYQIQDRIRRYFRHPVNIVVWQEYAEEVIFPTVTMCNENEASISKTTSTGRYHVGVVNSFHQTVGF